MKKLNIDEMKTIVISVLLMVIGILFCCSLSMGIDGLSVVIGLVLMVTGILFFVNSILGQNGIFTMEGVMGVVLLSLGIMFISHKLAGLIFIYIPWFLIVLGLAVILDAFLSKFVKGENGYAKFITKLIIGVVCFVLGLCLKLIDGFLEYASIMLGVLMIVYAAYLIFLVFNKNKSNTIK